jgi:hypothetical protein
VTERKDSELWPLMRSAENEAMVPSSPVSVLALESVQIVLRFATVAELIDRLAVEAWPWWCLTPDQLGFSVVPREHAGRVRLIVADWQAWLASQREMIEPRFEDK